MLCYQGAYAAPALSIGENVGVENRVEAFSDGVFVIVITLLILNVRVDRQRSLTLDVPRNLV
jgi:uncharacterized membrane protein